MISIFNRSLMEGYMPLQFKSAIITLLLKMDGVDIDELGNSCAISNVSTLSKLLERPVLSILTAIWIHKVLFLSCSQSIIKLPYNENHLNQSCFRHTNESC